MKINNKLTAVSLVLLVITVIWCFVITNIFIGNTPGNVAISKGDFTLIMTTALLLIVINLVVQSVSIYIWMKSEIKVYTLAIQLIISAINLTLVIKEVSLHV